MTDVAMQTKVVNQNVAYEVIGHFTKDDLTAIVTPFYNVFNTSGNVSATMPEEFAPQTGVTLYKTYYNVFVTALGRVEQATGLIAIPDSVDKASTPILSWQHGTVFGPEAGPTNTIISVPEGTGIPISDGRTVFQTRLKHSSMSPCLQPIETSLLPQPIIWVLGIRISYNLIWLSSRALKRLSNSYQQLMRY
jgi:beta-glucanase (GH16 family)